MRKAISVVSNLLCLFIAAHTGYAAEMTWEFSVQVSAIVQSDPAQITLNWPQDQYTLPGSYTIYRKSPGATSWGNGTTLPGTATSYVDNNVSAGTAYEYQVVKTTSQYTGYGYLYSGINLPMIDSRGKLLLVVENTHAASLANELAQLQQDLVGDGWSVVRLNVSRNDTAANVKSAIKAQYQVDPANVKAVFLFGHVPVPYSGNIVPDGHTPDHHGAWPSDGYYGDMDGAWTDAWVNTTGQYDRRNNNIPGDGKFDQNTFPAPIRLMVGRVDLANLPGAMWTGGSATFPSEVELLRNYLNKAHQFRTKQLDVPRRAIVGDFFGVRNGEAFAASGYRNFAPFFGANNIASTPTAGTWAPTLSTTPYLWAYGGGAGSFSSISGLGNSGSYNNLLSTEMYTSDIKAVFTLLFGSWLGDFDASDNIMRTVLALPSSGLSCAWSGRPHWFLQHMAMGEPIGFSARLTQNNGPDGLYRNQVNTGAGQIHIALMGDPALRMHVVAPPSNLRATPSGQSMNLAWTASTDSIIGYHVYRAMSHGTFTRLTTSPVSGTSYTDTNPGGSTNYMVRAVKLETSASGTYYNPSIGAFASPIGASSGSTSTSTGSGAGTNSTTNSVATVTNGTTTTTVANSTVWVDDRLPAGAISGAAGGDSWNWISSNPAPNSGGVATISSISSGFHQYYFYGATQTMQVNTGEVLFAYVYLDPSNPPSQIMLQWFNGDWEHRAFWGANLISNGQLGTAGRMYMGPLPATGQWVALTVPASAVGLAGTTVSGMAFTQYGGRAAWDTAGKGTGLISGTDSGTGSVSTGTTNNTTGSTTTTNITTSTNGAATLVNPVVFVEDALPTGAIPGSEGGDSWTWVSSAPAPFSGAKASISSLANGQHSYWFYLAAQPLVVGPNDLLFACVYLDANNPPSEIMLQFLSDSWEHRAYWGANNINNGTPNTAARVYMGPLPAAGRWVLLTIPAGQVGLAGHSVTGVAFSQFSGRAAWDYMGKASGLTSATSTTGSGSGTTVTTNTNGNTTTMSTNVTVWVEDGLPGGASPGSTGGDTWSWVNSGLSTPFSGSQYTVSSIAPGLHQYYFTAASQELTVNSGDTLCAAVYIDPVNVPSQVMLQWYDGSWEHRAYWGANWIDYGKDGTTGRVYMGPLPASGRWTLLQAPANRLGLEGSTVTGMAFSQYGGRAAWDYAGKLNVTSVTTNVASTNTSGTVTNISGTVTNSIPGTNTIGTATNTAGAGTNTVTNTNSTGVSTNSASSTNSQNYYTNALTGVSRADYVTPALPRVGDHTLHIITPTLLELRLVNTVPQGGSQVTEWNFVNGNSEFLAPPPSAFAVTANGSAVGVAAVGFKRRPIYAPLVYDLRVENSLYLQLSAPVSDNQVIEVKNPDGSLWSTAKQFVASVDPLRYSPALHVNQEGYMPSYTKKAMVGYYAGNLGEVNIPASAGFKIVDANSGAQVFQGSLVQRPDAGYTYTPAPYQKVYEADFTTFNTPGEYRLVVPGMGGSLPFLIDSGVAMAFARAYALGLYHQRCGTNTSMPFTRHEHGACHTAPASVPVSAETYQFTWKTIADYASRINQNNPPQIAPALSSPSAALFPYVSQGPVDVSGGHHDAGDYSKYTSNSGHLIHHLIFAVDSLPGVAALDNLGIPESGDGISDLLQEAKWEADYIAKMQDSDGGFYFLVYPKDRAYELDVAPDRGDPQVVWPKTTSVTAASVAALAQCATSPAFRQAYPAAAATYLEKARRGWQFLLNAINRYGKNGAYQKITHYADNFGDNDELAWAACQMYLATGDSATHDLLRTWFNPADPATWHWGWWHLPECYGHAIRSYAFAVQSARVAASQLDSTFLSKCQAEINAAANDMLTFSQKNAYGSSFPTQTKAVRAAGWYFSTDQAFDLAVAYALDPQPQYINAILANMNYEGGCNPVNVCYVTGLGWRRQRDIVSQWALNDSVQLPPSGIPVGNIGATFGYLWYYGGLLEGLCYPSSGATTAPYPFYDRWGDSWNVNNEMVVLNQARSMGTLGFLAAHQTSYRTQPWRAPADATIRVPAGVVPVGQPVTLTMQAPGLDLSNARITWEVRDQEPAYGSSFTFSPQNNGAHWVQAEAQLPDGRRVFAKGTFNVNAPNIVWVDDAVPTGAVTGSEGGDTWNWVSSNPAPQSGTAHHQSAIAAGMHQHYFANATATMGIGTGDVLYAWVYLDPANMPAEIMLQWNDGASWEHRAYWGANLIGNGVDGTSSRAYMGPLPTAGQWVQLRIPANKVGLEGATVNGMAFTAHGGGVSWDAAGRLSTNTGVTSAAVRVAGTKPIAMRTTGMPGEFTFTREGDTNVDLTIKYTLGGTAVRGVDYELVPSGPLAVSSLVIPAGATAATLRVAPLPSTNFVVVERITHLTLSPDPTYDLVPPHSASVTVLPNLVPATLTMDSFGPRLTWTGEPNRTYRVGFKNKLEEPEWLPAAEIQATSSECYWHDLNTISVHQRFYVVAQVN